MATIEEQVTFLQNFIEELEEQTSAHDSSLISTITAERYLRALKAMRNIITIEVYDHELDDVWDSPVLSEVVDALGFDKP